MTTDEALRMAVNAAWSSEDIDIVFLTLAHEVRRLRSMEQRALATFDEPMADPASLATARRILG